MVNDNSISGIALTLFLAIISGIVTIIITNQQLKVKAKEAAKAANDAKDEAVKAKENTVNVSNGFAGGVGKKLDYIIAEITRQRIAQDTTNAALREHLEWHLNKETS